MAHRSTPAKEPIVQHNFAARPWSKVGADLCELQGRTLLVVSDYYSNFIEVENITQANTAAVSKALKAMFARYGVPDGQKTSKCRRRISSICVPSHVSLLKEVTH